MAAAVQNAALVDSKHGVFSVLGLVSLRLGGPYLWHGEDIDDDCAKGTIFRAYECVDASDGDTDVASILVVDVSNDPTEPDIGLLNSDGVLALDEELRAGIEAELGASGMSVVRWMSSQLNQNETQKALVTFYTVHDHGKERQFLAVRMRVRSRKVVAIGAFDKNKGDTLAAPIVGVLRNMRLLS